MYRLANRLWHTDASFQDPPGRYSMLLGASSRRAADTEFADMRAAYDALERRDEARLEDLRVHHSIAYSRQTLGFEFSHEEADAAEGRSPSPRAHQSAHGRRSLYLASHASEIIDWPVPDGRLFLRDLIEHATQPRFRYVHGWRVGDLVIWDNRATMHRGLAYEDPKYRRELRRVTTLDIG